MKSSSFPVGTLLVALLIGCGPITNDDPPGGSPDATSGECVQTEATELSCFDNADNDCDGVFNCNDSDCFDDCNVGGGADAGVCEEPIFPGDTLAIPDILNVDYESSITISGFDPGQTLMDANNFLGLCVTMEHTWLRDLQLELDCPSGTTLILQEFRGRDGGEIYMGIPNDGDGVNPTPGTGYEYCWTPTATRGPSMTEWADDNLSNGDTLPTGDYQTSDPYTNLVGCELNGRWTVRVVDDWASDNGFIFGWTLEFASEILPDCLVVVID